MNPRIVHFLDGFLPHSLASAFAPGWFFMVGVAGLVGLAWMLAIARKHGIHPGVMASVLLWVYVAAVGAGIVMPMLIDAVQQQIATGHTHLRWAGMTSFWGYLAGGAALAIVCRDHGLSLARLGDLAAAPIGASLALVRIGCFLAGCDYGKVTSLPWAVRFPAGSPAFRDQVAAGLVPSDRLESLPVHPTQLYESLLGVAMCVLAIVLLRRRLAAGRVFVATIALYSVGRIGIEVLRADVGRGIYLGLSSGQIFSLCVLAAIGASLVRPRRLLTVAAAAALLLLVGHADADPQPPQPQPQAPQQPYPPQPYPYPPQQPYPYPPQQPYPYPPQPYPYPYPYPPQQQAPQTVEVAGDSSVEVGALVGIAYPLNRRQDQVGALAGPAVSVGYVFPHAGIYLDYQSYANADATHGTFLLSGGAMTSSGKLRFGGRAGIGPTLVNFHDPAFMDVTGTTVRFEATAEYDLTDTFVAWVRPLSIDTLTARDLGGPIVTWQLSAGVAYRFQMKHRVPAQATAAPPPTGAPTGAPPTAPPPPPAPPPTPPAPTGGTR